jgi:hypothetical protein
MKPEWYQFFTIYLFMFQNCLNIPEKSSYTWPALNDFSHCTLCLPLIYLKKPRIEA